MRRAVLIFSIIWPAVALAENWEPLEAEGIKKALIDKGITYEAATQYFYASGRTLYNAGADSWGYWRVEEDRYCSQWPPSDLWACYDMEISGQSIRFLGEHGYITIGVLAE
ncbi:hypothetical protein ACFFUT_05000 [Pseudohalocynthiibacter aestuariivivens]|jgi:hypothetical protein|uniref:DUF995 domain-containing protein n=1 Tax=Pseudohalocynthiibacter aestuariivivens TaxID=1591409 RepID=A0ABV5JCG7_9RHOB|nr:MULTISPECIES: hypothetical protein [Pseudohalocynthiibacter]MBS9718587.1 hypothetical protein [Pseudohalocynthiibacter aestuariivivens]MCK0103599.1 hypothetical protein [Pseudohalocynthiibacter sp. F2068]